MKRYLFLFLLIATVLFLFVGCSGSDESDNTAVKRIRLEIIENGNETVKEVETTKTTLLALLEELDLVEGSMGEYGYLVSAINGVEADMDNNVWWMIYKDGAWTDSLNKQKIADGETYVFKLETY